MQYFHVSTARPSQEISPLSRKAFPRRTHTHIDASQTSLSKVLSVSAHRGPIVEFPLILSFFLGRWHFRSLAAVAVTATSHGSLALEEKNGNKKREELRARRGEEQREHRLFSCDSTACARTSSLPRCRGWCARLAGATGTTHSVQCSTGQDVLSYNYYYYYCC